MQSASAFSIPTLFLGMISPVIAKMALDLGRERGRTIGDIYAFGVVGSIVGTFIAGYFLIAALGTLGVVWAVAVILAAMAFFYGRSPATLAWAVAACFLTFLSTSHADWARSIGESLKLRPTRDKDIIYSTESDYSYIQIVQISKDPDVRGMHLDTLLHSQLDMDRPGDFRYDYEKVYLAITLRMRPNADRIDSLTIGGGGYVHPRYMNARWPRGRTDVVEIDPAVTEAAMVAFGLPRDTTIRPFHEDGRVYIDRLIAEKREGKPVEPYDFIYCDAVNDYSVPHQLTTREFMSEVHELIKPDGAYLMNMIDIYESDKFDGGLLLGSLITTM
ncbi:MAG: fused MFS/spermidine synthase, partial [Planctomycetes bacterium]|nr:fused MFS/spermidine synthase [Planctomycetota bacterium]